MRGPMPIQGDRGEGERSAWKKTFPGGAGISSPKGRPVKLESFRRDRSDEIQSPAPPLEPTHPELRKNIAVRSPLFASYLKPLIVAPIVTLTQKDVNPNIFNNLFVFCF